MIAERPESAFLSAIMAAGLTPPEFIEPDGTMHRFSSNGKRGDKSGWYVLHLDGVPAGVFGCWRDGLSQTWCSKPDNTLTEAEKQAMRQRVKAAQAARDVAQIQARQQAQATAQARWKAASLATAGHFYLVTKDVQAHGLRLEGDKLVIPLCDVDGVQHSLQTIAPNGEKRFLTDGKKKGCFYALGQLGPVLVICEGFATGASIHEATGLPVAVAFDAGNLLPVAQALRTKYPDTKLILAADNDTTTEGNTGLAKATEAAQATAGMLALAVSSTDPDKKMDFNDLHQSEGLEAVAHLIDAAAPVESVAPEMPAYATDFAPLEHSDSQNADSKDSLSSLLVAFVVGRTELFHDENRDSFALVHSAQETYRLTGGKFKSWLMAEFYKASGKAARDQSVREALQVLDGLAQHDGEQKAVHIRVAHHDGAIYVDLAQPGSSMAAKIEAGRWELVPAPPVRFLRPDTMRPLPTPTVGEVSQLWHFVNVPEDARLLVLAWLLECLRPDSVFPVLELIGEAGSAKSTTQRYLRMLIDPNASNLRSPPKSVEDVFVSAGMNWVVSFENVSHLAAPMQDALCVLATGGGYAKRKHYTDADESVINVTRPVVINGISASITAHDLIDRSICIEPQRLHQRREDGDIQREFEAAYPSLVAGLFLLMAQTLKELPSTRLPDGENIRMAGFARLGVAMERALGAPAGEFLRQFHASRQESIARTIDSSPVATALLEWFESQFNASAEMSAKVLLTEVERFKPLGADAWPKSAKGFGDALRRAAPSPTSPRI
ncbi:MAG: toprim domain-containing protein [Burkholderiaceae bacterium]|nr:toprim domain-containing protein [Burkholderiaceae bacterium]